jgi:hypothetical protein
MTNLSIVTSCWAGAFFDDHALLLRPVKERAFEPRQRSIRGALLDS